MPLQLPATQYGERAVALPSTSDVHLSQRTRMEETGRPLLLAVGALVRFGNQPVTSAVSHDQGLAPRANRPPVYVLYLGT